MLLYSPCRGKSWWFAKPPLYLNSLCGLFSEEFFEVHCMELVFQFVDGFCFLCTVSEIRTKARRCSYWSFHSTVQRKDVAFRFGDDRNPVDPHCPQKLRTIRTMKFFSDANLTLQSSTFRSPTSIHICQGICAETIHCFERFLAPHRSIDRYSHAIR